MIEDFSIYIKNIPIKPEDYDNNQDLLQAMISVNLEKILIQRFMADQNISEDQAKDLS